MVETKIMKVFYDANCLPYKDKERQTHYPIIGSSFTGASGTTEIRFYIDQIGDLDLTWVANAKLPNGKTGSKVLSTSGNDDDGAYVSLSLTQWFTQLKGDLYISLQGYQGGINYTYDDETELYNISGTPIIQATGVIKINIAFSSPFNAIAELSGEDYQSLLALIADSNTKGFTVVDDISVADLSNYGVGHLIYDKETNRVYTKTNASPYYSLYRGFLKDYLPYIDITGVAGLTNTIINMCSSISNYGVDTAVVKLKSAGVVRTFIMQAYTTDGSGVYANVIAYELSSGSPTFYYAPNILSSLGVENVFQGSTYKVDLVSQNWVKQNFPPLVSISQTLDYVYTNYQDRVVMIYGTSNLKSVSGFIRVSSTYKVSGVVNVGQEVRVFRENAVYSSSNTIISVLSYTNKLATESYVATSIDSALQEFLQKEYDKVDITTYPTLEDFLESTGEEGYIYLYPIDTTDDTKGYYQYIWENDEWISLGTTNIDLSGYLQKTNQANKVYGTDGSGLQTTYDISNSNTANTIAFRNGSGNINVGTPTNDNEATPKTYVDTLISGYVPTSRTIAGLSLTSNISASDLNNALGFEFTDVIINEVN